MDKERMQKFNDLDRDCHRCLEMGLFGAALLIAKLMRALVRRM